VGPHLFPLLAMIEREAIIDKTAHYTKRKRTSKKKNIIKRFFFPSVLYLAYYCNNGYVDLGKCYMCQSCI
jgi:hypothetical protein